MVSCKVCDFTSKTGNVVQDVAIVIAHSIKEHPELEIDKKLNEVTGRASSQD